MNLSGLVGGFAQGSNWMMNIQRARQDQDERKRKQADQDAASASTANAVAAQYGTRQKVAGDQPTNVAGQEVDGPPQYKFETVYDAEKERELQVKAIRDIGKAYGPQAAMQLNDLFRNRQEQVTRQAGSDMLGALEAGDLKEVPAIFNRTRIGGYMDSIEGNKETGYTIRIRGEEEPRKVSHAQLAKQIGAKTMKIESYLDQEYRERQQLATEKHQSATEKHQADTLAEQSRHNQAMEGVYRDNYTARNANQADANIIRAQGVAARRERLDRTYQDSHFETEDPLTGKKSLDLRGKAVAPRLHEAFTARGQDDDTARMMTMEAISKAREESNGDPKLYQQKLQHFLDVASGKVKPEGGNTAPQKDEPKPPPASGITPPKADPLADGATVPADHPSRTFAVRRDELIAKSRAAASDDQIIGLERAREQALRDGDVAQANAIIQRIKRIKGERYGL